MPWLSEGYYYYNVTLSQAIQALQGAFAMRQVSSMDLLLKKAYSSQRLLRRQLFER